MVVLIHLICYLLYGLCCVIGKVQVPHLLGRNGHDGKGLLVLLVGRQPHLVHHGLVTVLVDGDGRGMHPGTRRDMMKSHKRIPAEVVVCVLCVCLNKLFQFNCYHFHLFTPIQDKHFLHSISSCSSPSPPFLSLPPSLPSLSSLHLPPNSQRHHLVSTLDSGGIQLKDSHDRLLHILVG